MPNSIGIAPVSDFRAAAISGSFAAGTKRHHTLEGFFEDGNRRDACSTLLTARHRLYSTEWLRPSPRGVYQNWTPSPQALWRMGSSTSAETVGNSSPDAPSVPQTDTNTDENRATLASHRESDPWSTGQEPLTMTSALRSGLTRLEKNCSASACSIQPAAPLPTRHLLSNHRVRVTRRHSSLAAMAVCAPMEGRSRRPQADWRSV